MYVSHPVRRIREEPMAGEDVTLLLEVSDEASVDAVADAVRDLGGTVERERQFDTLEVTVAQDRVDDVCSLDGIGVVETAATIELEAADAGEDVDPDLDLDED